MRGCVDAWMRGCVDAWMRGCVDACMRVCVCDACVCMRACACVCVCACVRACVRASLLCWINNVADVVNVPDLRFQGSADPLIFCKGTLCPYRPVLTAIRN